MAERPVFTPLNKYPWYEITEISFHWAAGFALVQKQKNITALHEGWENLHPDQPVLEASSKAATELGKSMSPFYLELDGIPVENQVQAAKVFQNGGPYLQALDMPAIKAKTWGKLKESGALLYYRWQDTDYPVWPRGWFATWMYLQALRQHPAAAEAVKDYAAFTDIAFNPKTGHACQARSLAIYCGLEKKGKLQEAMESWESFRKTVFREPS